MNKLVTDFSLDNLLNFFKTKVSSFKPLKENKNQILEDNSFEQFTELTKIGEIDFNGVEDLLVFACKSNTPLTERSAKKVQFEIAKKVLKEDFKDGAIFVFYDAMGNFRFSFLRKNYGNKEQKFTTWKRYTYYVEKDKPNKTFKDRVGNADFSSLDALQKAFSVEKLTEDFYKELFNWYTWTLSEEVGVTFPNNTETSDDDRVKLEEQIIRLITRLLFVWFIKQKKLVPNNLFETEKLKTYLTDFDANSKTEGNYYNAILQNLFFATLNKEINGRAFSKLEKERDIKTLYRYAEIFSISETEILALFNQVPFLNGGLFECLDKTKKMDGANEVLDGFSKNETRSANGNFKHRAFIPNCVFFDENKGIIPLLERYNFTVEENAPNEIQVALDPELLGNVFENLLGAFNPETKETARKQSGSFYTPREIVSYMVDESLIFYLLNAFPNLKEDSIRELFTAEEMPTEFTVNHLLCEEISQKLKEIKILDPACGSGAFPMGILNRMVTVLEKLACHKEKSVYDLKLHLIEECIYGVDIQPIAVQISKLRFFISLIVEEDNIDLTKKEDNYGIVTLPNLETKFVSANTLIGLEKSNKELLDLNDKTLEVKKTTLWEIRKQHFYAKSANEKKKLRIADETLRDEIKNYISANASKPNLAFIQTLQNEITQLEKKRENIEGELWVDETTKLTQVVLFDGPAKQPSIFKVDKNIEERKKIDARLKAIQAEIDKENNKVLNVGFEKEIEIIAKWNPYDQNASSPFFDVEWMFGLRSESADAGCFDLVIGNPPYVSVKSISTTFKGYLAENYLTGKGRLNLYTIFIEKGFNELSLGGVMSYIVPDNLYSNIEYRFAREIIIEKGRVNKICLFSKRVFEAAVDTAVFIVSKSPSAENKICIEKDLKEHFNELLQSQIRNYPFYLMPVKSLNKNLKLIEKLMFNERSTTLGNFVEVQQGIIYSGQAKEDVFSNEVLDKTYKKCLDGRDILRYKINWNEKLDCKYISYTNKLHRPREERLFINEKKILIPRRATRLYGSMDYEQFFALNTAYIILGKVESTISLEFFLALINSKLYNFIYNQLYFGWQITIPALVHLPVFVPSHEAVLEINQLVLKILNSGGEGITKFDLQIDTIIYKNFDLDLVEVLIIDPEFPLSQSEYANFKIEEA